MAACDPYFGCATRRNRSSYAALISLVVIGIIAVIVGAVIGGPRCNEFIYLFGALHQCPSSASYMSGNAV